MEVFKRSFLLMRESIRLLGKDQEVIIFPILTFVINTLVLVGGYFFLRFLITMFVMPLADNNGDILVPFLTGTLSSAYNACLLTFVFFVIFLQSFFSAFFGMSLTAVVQARIQGRDIGVKEGMRQAAKRTGKIFFWSLLCGTIGIFFALLERKLKIIGRLSVWIFGTLWSVCTFFIMQVMLLEDLPVLPSIKKSGNIVAQKWGETFIDVFSMRALFTTSRILAFLLIVLASATNIVVLYNASIIFFVLWLICSIALESCLNAVLRVVLYEYTVHGTLPRGFNPALFSNVPFAPTSHVSAS